MPKEKDLYAYEDRYRTVYGVGARFWNEHQMHPRLIEYAKGLPEGSTVIEFGCGEGFEARALASMGLRVKAIDLSSTVIEKGKIETPSTLQIEYLVGDVTDLLGLGIEDCFYDLGIDVCCLHMMSDPEDRRHYLAEARRVLKDGSLFYLQNGLLLEDVVPRDDSEAREVEQLRKFQESHPGNTPTPRKIATAEGEREILLPLCPTNRFQTLREYCDEIVEAGFTVIVAERIKTIEMGYNAIVIAKNSKKTI